MSLTSPEAEKGWISAIQGADGSLVLTTTSVADPQGLRTTNFMHKHSTAQDIGHLGTATEASRHHHDEQNADTAPEGEYVSKEEMKRACETQNVT